MSDFNQITLIGNLVKDPELTYTENGVAKATLRIANNTKLKSGEKETIFINVICFNGLAENVSQYLTKGSRVLVSGRYRQRIWEKDTKEKITIPEILATTIYFLDKKDKEDGSNIPNEAELYEEPF